MNNWADPPIATDSGCGGRHEQNKCELLTAATNEKYQCPNCGGNHPAYSKQCPEFAKKVTELYEKRGVDLNSIKVARQGGPPERRELIQHKPLWTPADKGPAEPFEEFNGLFEDSASVKEKTAALNARLNLWWKRPDAPESVTKQHTNEDMTEADQGAIKTLLPIVLKVISMVKKKSKNAELLEFCEHVKIALEYFSSYFYSKNAMLTIVHVNINSISRKVSEIKNYLATHHVDILCVVESKHRSIPQMTGYKSAAIEPEGDKRLSRGTIVYVRNHLHTTQLNIQTPSSTETTMLSLKIHTKDSNNFNLHTVYNPPGKELCLALLEAGINYDTDPNLIVGDFNASHPKINLNGRNATDDAGKRIVEFLRDSGMVILNPLEPTFLRTGTRPDLIIADGEVLNKAEQCTQCTVLCTQCIVVSCVHSVHTVHKVMISRPIIVQY